MNYIYIRHLADTLIQSKKLLKYILVSVHELKD